MSIEIEAPDADRVIVTYDPDIDQGEDLYLMAAISEFLWANFGIPLDCDRVELHMVYSPDDAGRQAPSSRAESPTQ